METLTSRCPNALLRNGEKSPARLEFARRLRELRVPRGFRTARSLAKALGIDENRYTRYERAEVEPDLALIRRICSVLGITPTDLLGVEDGEPVALDAAAEALPPMPKAERAPHARPLAETTVDLATWKLACAVARVKLGIGHYKDGNDGASMALIAAASPLYKRLRASPFEVVAELATDTAVAKATEPASSEVAAAVDGLVAVLRSSV